MYDLQSTGYHLQQIHQTLNSWLFEVVIGYHIKINLATSVSVPLFALRLQSEPPETSETTNICMLMASFLVSHIQSQIPVYAITDDTYFDILSNGTNKQWFRIVF